MKEMKTFVLDTNVLIHRPDALLSFKDSEVVIPIEVFEELDKLKTEHHSGRGKSARAAIRTIENIIRFKNVEEGVKLESGGVLRIPVTEIPKSSDLSLKKIDNRIIYVAHKLKTQGKQVFFVSKDINARIKAEAMGIKAVDYEKNRVEFSSQYSGVIEKEITDKECLQLEENNFLELEGSFFSNQFGFFTHHGSKTIHIGRYMTERGGFVRIPSSLNAISGISPLNTQQRAAFDLLLDDSVPLVTLVGRAGTGKTLLAIAVGLYKVLEEKKYSRVLVSRPIVPMGHDIGYLPGEKFQKMSHWMQPIFDNLEFITKLAKKQNLKNVEQLMNSRSIEVEALTYIRGRSLPEQFIIIDEAQNLSPHEVKTIVSRAGNDTKVILTGDPYQIDNPYIDAESNGLTTLVEAFKSECISGHVTLTKTERSPLAEKAAELL